MQLTAETTGVSLVRAESRVCRVQTAKLDLGHPRALVLSESQCWNR